MIRIRIQAFAALAALSLGAVTGCSDSVNDPDIDDGNVQIQAGLESTRVPFGKSALGTGVVVAPASGAVASGDGQTVDSLHITGFRLMVAEIKLHRSGGGGEDKVKTGPALLSVDEDGVEAVIVGTVPAGTYNKVNFKFHRLNDEEVIPFIDDEDFEDFTTDDRFTIIVEGLAWENGSATPFSYGSRVEEDLKFDLEDIEISETDVTVIVIRIDPVDVFRDNDSGEVLDPRDPENFNPIDDAIKASLNALRK